MSGLAREGQIKQSTRREFILNTSITFQWWSNLVHIAQFSMCESMHPRHSTFLHPLQSYEEQRRWSQKLLLQDTQENGSVRPLHIGGR